MKTFDEYYNSQPTKLTDEELKEWAEVHTSKEEIEQLDPDDFTMEEKQMMLDKIRVTFNKMNQEKIDKYKSLSPIKNNGFVYDEYLDLDRTITESFLEDIHSEGLDRILDELTVEEEVIGPMGDVIKKKNFHIV